MDGVNEWCEWCERRMPEIVQLSSVNRIFSFRTFVSIGTQKRFYSNVHNLIASIKRDKKNCNKKNTETIDRHFSPSFDVDWCKSSLVIVFSIRIIRKLIPEIF